MRCDRPWPTPATTLLVTCIAVSLLAGCKAQPPATATAYFPLQPGRTWSYRIVVDATDELDREDEPLAMKVATIGPEEIAGVRVTRQEVDRDGATYALFLGVDEHGIFRQATRSPGDKAPVIATQRFYFLRDPLRVGSSWPGRSAPTFIDIMGFFGPVDVVSTVKAIGETVRTPAGEFRDTVRVEVKGTARVGDDEDAGAEAASKDDGWDLYRGTFTRDETIWLARDVGMVKSVLVEHFKGDFDDRTVTATTELESFTR